MNPALAGLLLGVTTASLSVYSLWLITDFTAKAATEIHPVEPSRWWKRFAFFQWDPEDEIELPTEESPSLPPLKPDTGASRAATLRIFFAFLLKAPILFAVARVAQSFGDAGLHWCVGGVVLVYFLAVFWAAVRTNRR